MSLEDEEKLLIEAEASEQLDKFRLKKLKAACAETKAVGPKIMREKKKFVSLSRPKPKKQAENNPISSNTMKDNFLQRVQKALGGV